LLCASRGRRRFVTGAALGGRTQDAVDHTTSELAKNHVAGHTRWRRGGRRQFAPLGGTAWDAAARPRVLRSRHSRSTSCPSSRTRRAADDPIHHCNERTHHDRCHTRRARARRLVIVEFPTGESTFNGEVADELLALVEAGTIRLIDLLILTKDDDGHIDALELSDLKDLGPIATLQAELAELLAEDDVEHLAAAMEPGSVAGVSLRDVQEFARHADPRTTRRYDRARGALDRNAAYALANVLAGKPS
jgi:hypothetical protein